MDEACAAAGNDTDGELSEIRAWDEDRLNPTTTVAPCVPSTVGAVALQKQLQFPLRLDRSQPAATRQVHPESMPLPIDRYNGFVKMGANIPLPSGKQEINPVLMAPTTHRVVLIVLGVTGSHR